jgi:hypothetical protein
VAFAVLLAPGGPPVGQPGLRQVPNAPRVWDSADPAVLVDGGQTYLFGSTNNMPVPVRPIASFTVHGQRKSPLVAS